MNTNALPSSPVTPAERKAIEHAHAGRRPTFVSLAAHDWQTSRCYTVPSSTDQGTYSTQLIGNPDGLFTACDCPAGEAGRHCWHQAAVLLDHLGALPTPTPVTVEPIERPVTVEPIERPVTVLFKGQSITITQDDLFGPPRHRRTA